MATRRKRSINFLPAEPRSEPSIDISAYPVDIGVGELLRLTRERLGHELQSVANQLRIRLSYLEAIEESRFRDLPGTTYAIGFVRSYADYLGLDGPDIVRRFREEAARIHGRTKLIFPNLAIEGKVPRAAILLVSALTLGLAYTAWYVLSSRQDHDVPVIAEVPDRLIALTPQDGEGSGVSVPPPDPTVLTPSPAVPQPETSAVSPGPQPDATPSGTAASAGDGAAVQPAPDVTSPETDAVADVPTVAAPEVPAAVPEAPAPSADVSQPSEPQVEADAPTAPADAATVPPPAPTAGALTAEAAAPTPPQDTASSPSIIVESIPPAPATPSVQAPEQLQQAALVEGARGVVLEARMDSWIKVVDANGKTVTNQVLKAGDRYVVPDQPGLILRTGNAGGLDVLVGGQKSPPLGEVGEVHQKIVLDPDLLMSGTAGSQ